jgi:ferredoxin
MGKSLRISVDHAKCVGSTMCVLTSPSVFALDEKGQSIVRDAAGDTRDRVVEAAEQCPMSAITVEDAETGRRLFPASD